MHTTKGGLGVRSDLSPEIHAAGAPPDIGEMKMRQNTCLFQEIRLVTLIVRSRKSLTQCVGSLGVCALALFAGLNACASLAAQQAEVDDPLPAVLTASPDAAPAPDPVPQAPAAAPQSPNPSGSQKQNSQAQSAPGDAAGRQTKRILGIVPNFRAVSADEKLPPETIKEKFVDATEDSFDYSSIFIPAVIAAYNMRERTTPEFHEGAAGYARYFWHSAVDQTSENYMVEFIFPTFTREDARYYTLGHGGFFKRTGYALSRAVITRSNSGAAVFNVSEVVGAGAASGISNLYYPSASRSVGNTMSEWAEDVGIDAASFWVKEFWPDINRRVFHNKYSDTPAQR
jgi:hypothetical protein